MSRGHRSSDNFKYLDKEIILHPDTGKFYVPDYDTQHETLEEAKAEIKSHQAKRDKAPKIAVWFRGHSWGLYDRGPWQRGQTSGHVGGRNSGNDVVVTYTDERNRAARISLHYNSVYPINDENNELVAQIGDIEAQIKALIEQRKALENNLTSITPLKD